MTKSRMPTINDVEASLVAAEDDIAAGKTVPGDVLHAQLQARLDRYEADKAKEAEPDAI